MTRILANMSDKKVVQKIVLGGVILNNAGKFLILQRHENEDIYPNMWELPSGKKEPLELSKDALLREIKEEAGVKVEVLVPFSVFDYQIEKPEEIRDSTQINYLTKLKENQSVKISNEHQKFDWVSADKLENYNLTDATKNVLREAFKISKLLKLI